MEKGELYTWSDEDFNNDVIVVNTLAFDKVLEPCLCADFDVPRAVASNAFRIASDSFDNLKHNIPSFSRLGVKLISIECLKEKISIQLQFNNAKDKPIVPYSMGVVC